MSEDSLLASTVPRTLETKNKIMGLELTDVLFLLINISVQNLIFGSTAFKIPMVFGTTIGLFLVLFLFKRGKPDGFIQHFCEHLMQPTTKSANAPDLKYQTFQKGDFV